MVGRTPHPLVGSGAVSSPYRACNAIFASNSGACFLGFGICDSRLLEDQQTAKLSLCQRPNLAVVG